MDPSSEGIIPQKLEVDTTLKVVLPPEVSSILRDLHHDRAGIAVGGMVLLACVVFLTWKKISDR